MKCQNVNKFSCHLPQFLNLIEFYIPTNLSQISLKMLKGINSTGAGVVDGVVFIIGEAGNVKALDDQRREGDVPLEEDGHSVLVRHGLVHERMVADKVEHGVGQRLRVVDALTGTRLGHFG